MIKSIFVLLYRRTIQTNEPGRIIRSDLLYWNSRWDIAISSGNFQIIQFLVGSCVRIFKMGNREVPLYFLVGCMLVVALFVLCLLFAVVCPYTRIRAFFLRYCGYKESEMEYYAKLQQQRGDMSWANTRTYTRRVINIAEFLLWTDCSQ